MPSKRTIIYPLIGRKNESLIYQTILFCNHVITKIILLTLCGITQWHERRCTIYLAQGHFTFGIFDISKGNGRPLHNLISDLLQGRWLSSLRDFTAVLWDSTFDHPGCKWWHLGCIEMQRSMEMDGCSLQI